MIKEDYVSFEIAKLLKDKGFDEYCFCINYPTEGGHHNIILQNLLNNSMIPFTSEYKFCRYKEDYITMPTLQMAMKWLREVHNIHIVPMIENNGNYIGYIYDTKGNNVQGWDRRLSKTSYEVACEAAIRYCLENLI